MKFLRFEDVQFENIVKRILNKSQEDNIYKDDLDKVRGVLIAEGEHSSINIPWSGDADAFNMSFPEIRFDISQSENGLWVKDLSLFKKIKSLHIYTQIEDLSFLSDFKDLKELYIYGYEKENWSFIEHLISLEYLCVNKSMFTDLVPIAELCKKQQVISGGASNKDKIFSIHLRNLMLNNCGIYDISPLKNCKYISELNLSHNKITDLTPLSEIQSLYWLVLRYNNIEDIEPLGKLRNLYSLNLRHNKITDITILENFKDYYIRRLYIKHNNIKDYSALIDIRLVDSDVGEYLRIKRDYLVMKINQNNEIERHMKFNEIMIEKWLCSFIPEESKVSKKLMENLIEVGEVFISERYIFNDGYVLDDETKKIIEESNGVKLDKYLAIETEDNKGTITTAINNITLNGTKVKIETQNSLYVFEVIRETNINNSKDIKEEKILKNSIQCKYCGDIIESKTTHDFVKCSCGRCCVDGGKDYLRRLAENDNCYIELSIIEN